VAIYFWLQYWIISQCLEKFSTTQTMPYSQTITVLLGNKDRADYMYCLKIYKPAKLWDTAISPYALS
jgi:hypothetical protein